MDGKVIFVLFVVLLAAIEVVSGLLALRWSRVVAFALVGLGVFQLVALWLFFTSPEYTLGAADLGGVSLAPVLVLFVDFWVTVLVLTACVVRVLVLFVRKPNIDRNTSKAHWAPKFPAAPWGTPKEASGDHKKGKDA